MNPIAAIVVTLVLLALFIASLILISRSARRRGRDRRQAFADAAVARGWTYEATGTGWTNEFGVKPFRRGATRRPKALDVVSGMLYGHRAVGFHYRYTRGTNPDNLADIYSWFTVCGVRLPHELESVEPSRKSFTVDRSNEMVRRIMLARRRVKWSIDGNWLICWERGTSARPEEVFARLELLADIVDGRVGQIRVA